MYFKIMVLVATCFTANIMCSTQETGEEGKPVTLKCTDSVSTTNSTLFQWYKIKLPNQLISNRIAFYDNSDGVQNSFGDFANRATIDRTTGALTILNTQVSDDRFYSCWFTYTLPVDIKDETQLIITVTPSQQDLKITTSPTGQVKEGEIVSYNCSASRVKPPPRQMYWQFTDDASQHNGTYRNERNADSLTSSVSVNYTMVVKRKDNGRKVVCHYVSEAGNDIQSEEATVEVIYMPTGQPQIIPKYNKTVRVNSTVSLKCDTEQIDGAITWYKWQFVNGTDLSNTTEKSWTYTARGNEETLQIVCIAGNAAGQSNASEPIAIEIQHIDMPTGQSQIRGDKRTVRVNSTVSLTCDTEQIDGMITWYKWQFVNGTDLGSTTEKTWTYTSRGNDETLQIVCIAGNAAGQRIASTPISIEIKSNVSGQPVNYVIVVLGTLLALVVAKDFVIAAYYCLRRTSTYGRVSIQKNTVPIKKDGAVTRDQGVAMVDAAAYEEVDDRAGIKGLKWNSKQNLKGATEDGSFYKNVSNNDVALYEDMDAINGGKPIRNHNQFYENRQVDVVPSDYEEPRGEAPTYLELH